MTDQSHESAIDRAVREATERGDFDNLAGTGQPLADAAPHSERWYLEQFAKREEAGSAFLPTSLLLRKEAADLPGRVARMHTEAVVRAAVADLNERIAAEIRVPTGGPSLAMRLLDADQVVADWSAAREQARLRRQAESAAVVPAVRPRRRWWGRRQRDASSGSAL